MKLTAHRYGKNRVRVMKVLRDGPVHTVTELSARVLLEGAFDDCFTAADNRAVIATDSIKNIVHVLAHDCLGVDIEPFARAIAAHLLDRYPQVSRATVTLDERVWSRLRIGGADHPHSFAQAEVARPFTRVRVRRTSGEKGVFVSGVRDLILLKSTGSGFEAFHRDEMTTLADTKERILASAIRASWSWTREPASYADANRAIREALIAPFAQRYSPSVQATLFDMATAALDACPEIGRVKLVMPNLHCLPIDLTPFDRVNRGSVFVPTDEPHGQIEAIVTR